MAGREQRMSAELLRKLGYRPDASRSERVRWLVWRIAPVLLVVLAAHYLLRGPVESPTNPMLPVAIICLAIGLIGIVQASTARLGLVRASIATGLLSRSPSPPSTN